MLYTNAAFDPAACCVVNAARWVSSSKCEKANKYEWVKVKRQKKKHFNNLLSNRSRVSHAWILIQCQLHASNCCFFTIKEPRKNDSAGPIEWKCGEDHEITRVYFCLHLCPSYSCNCCDCSPPPHPFFKHINVLLSAVFIFICTDFSHILTQPVGGSLDSFWRHFF